jgi:hypothetical protein
MWNVLSKYVNVGQVRLWRCCALGCKSNGTFIYSRLALATVELPVAVALTVSVAAILCLVFVSSYFNHPKWLTVPQTL